MEHTYAYTFRGNQLTFYCVGLIGMNKLVHFVIMLSRVQNIENDRNWRQISLVFFIHV